MNQLINNYKGHRFSEVLFLLLPILLVTGPFLPDLSLSIIGLIMLFNFEKKLIIGNNYIKLFIAFYFLIVISSLFSEYKLYSLKSSFFYIRFGLFALATYILLSLNDKVIINLTKIFILILFVIFFDTLVQYFFKFNIFGWRVEDQNFRLTSMFGKDEVLGSYFARFFPLILSLILYSKENLKLNISNYIIYCVILFSIIICFLSGERTSFILLFISLITIIFTCKSLSRPIFLMMVFGLLLISSTIAFDKKVKNRMIDFTISQLGLNSSSERVVIFSEIYEDHYEIALNMFKEKPLIGHGVKSFRKYCIKPENYVSDYGCTTHPHNIYMQLLAETGILSFLIIFFLFLVLVFRLFSISFNFLFKKKSNYKDYLTLMYIFYAVNLFPFSPSGNFFNNWMSIIYFLPSGYFIFLNKKNFYV